MLYVCATPIGNLEDITLRVLRILQEVDLIVAEDTRQTRKLLSHYQIAKPLTSLHKFNEREKSGHIIELLKQGKSVAYVSDAGMPGISDPGAELIAKAIAADLPLTVLPGANAALTAVVQSGLLTGPFYFHGFLPRRQAQVAALLADLADLTCPLVFYEAPHRLVETLSALQTHLGDRRCSISRELTKLFEETRRGRLSELIEHFAAAPPRGEFVIVVAGADPGAHAQQNDSEQIRDCLRQLLEQGLSKKEAAKAAAQQLGAARNEVYKLALELGRQGRLNGDDS